VLFVTTSFPRFSGDAAGSFVFRWAKYLVRDGMQVTVLAPAAIGYPPQEDMAGVRIVRLAYFYPAHWQCLAYTGGGMVVNLRQHWLARCQVPFLFGAMLRALRQYQRQVDIVHCHWLPTAIAGLMARGSKRQGPPLVFTPWGSDTRLLPSWLVRWTVARMDGCTSAATETDAHFLASGRTDFRRIMAPVDEERYRRTTVSTTMRYELGIDDQLPVLAFVGRLYEEKDPLTFIRACALLKCQGLAFVALIAGDGHLMALCQREIEHLGVQDVVRLLGLRSDTERLLAIATATVNICTIENTWANTIAEAMFMQVPVVLSNAGYTERLFTHEKDCLIIPVRDPVALAAALRRLVDNPALGQRLVQGAQDLLQRYKKDQATIVQETRAYYDDILQRRDETVTYA
jgi:glycosyltransferase involved in cell wall biosynthesis